LRHNIESEQVFALSKWAVIIFLALQFHMGHSKIMLDVSKLP